MYAEVEEMLEAVFSMWSAMAAASLCNIAAARNGVVCVVHPEAVKQGPMGRK
jgi:hypothetical protein